MAKMFTLAQLWCSRSFAIFSLFCILSDHILKVNGYICEVGREQNENHEWKWVLPYPNPCGCTKIIMGGMNTWTPIRPFKPVYVDNPSLSNNTTDIRRHYGLRCGDETSSSINDVTTNKIKTSTKSTGTRKRTPTTKVTKRTSKLHTSPTEVTSKNAPTTTSEVSNSTSKNGQTNKVSKGTSKPTLTTEISTSMDSATTSRDTTKREAVSGTEASTTHGVYESTTTEANGESSDGASTESRDVTSETSIESSTETTEKGSSESGEATSENSYETSTTTTGEASGKSASEASTSEDPIISKASTEGFGKPITEATDKSNGESTSDTPDTTTSDDVKQATTNMTYTDHLMSSQYSTTFDAPAACPETATTIAPQGTCQRGWESAGEYCYYFNHTARVTFEVAQKACRCMLSEPVSIYSNNEQSFLAAKTVNGEPNEDYWSYWIGLTNVDVGNNRYAFVWIDGNQGTYRRWLDGEPNHRLNNGYSSEKCTGMVQKFSKFWNSADYDKWNNISCQRKYAYICKKTK